MFIVVVVCVTIGIFIVELRPDLKKIEATVATSARAINDMVMIFLLFFINI